MLVVSPKLAAWADEALDLGFGSFSDGDRAPFILLVEATGKRQLLNLGNTSGAINPELLDGGRDIIRQFPPGKFYALVWDGFLTTEGKRQDAVFAEAGEGAGAAFVFAQRYKQSRQGKMTKLGKCIIASDAIPLWAKNVPARR